MWYSVLLLMYSMSTGDAMQNMVDMYFHTCDKILENALWTCSRSNQVNVPFHEGLWVGYDDKAKDTWNGGVCTCLVAANSAYRQLRYVKGLRAFTSVSSARLAAGLREIPRQCHSNHLC